jgi:hypothetical protein
MRWCSVNEIIARKRFQLMRPVSVILLAVVMIMIIVKYCSVPKLVSSLGPSFHTWNQPFDNYNLLLLGFPILGSWNAQLNTVSSHCWLGLVWFSWSSKLPWKHFHGVSSAIWLRFHCFVVCTPSNSTMFDSGNALLKSSLVQSAEQQARVTQECSCVERRAALQKLPNNWYCSLWL